MRYADGPTVEADIHVDAPAAVVWALVSDIGLPARFSSEFLGARWLDGASPARGARFVGRNRHPAVGEWETTCIVVAYEPECLFAWAVDDADFPMSSWRFELQPEPGGTRLHQWMRIGPAPSPLSRAIEAMPDKEERIVARRLAEHHANMQATLGGIKALAEQGGPDAAPR